MPDKIEIAAVKINAANKLNWVFVSKGKGANRQIRLLKGPYWDPADDYWQPADVLKSAIIKQGFIPIKSGKTFDFDGPRTEIDGFLNQIMKKKKST